MDVARREPRVRTTASTITQTQTRTSVKKDQNISTLHPYCIHKSSALAQKAVITCALQAKQAPSSAGTTSLS